MEQSKSIPKEIFEVFAQKAEAAYPETGLNKNGDKKSRQHQAVYRKGASEMYHRMAEEAETLRKERDAYLGLLNELKAALAHHDTLTIVQQSGFHQRVLAALEQYSSPVKPIDNG